MNSQTRTRTPLDPLRARVTLCARTRAPLGWLLTVTLCAAFAACSTVGMGPEFDDSADYSILFVGNSLTYVNDVPGLVRQLAQRQDISVSTVMIAYPDYSLQDHFNSGIADEIRRLRADIVVMQQGPSSLPENSVHLANWAEQLAGVIREAGGEPAMYMVWPDVSRRFAFPAVEAAYADAATAINGRLLPAGTTWLRAWDADANLQLYAADGLHSGYLGALAAAHTIYAGLFDVDPATLPALDDNVPAATLDLLRTAVATSLAQWPRSSSLHLQR